MHFEFDHTWITVEITLPAGSETLGWPRRYSRHGHSRPGLFLRTLRQRSRQENTFNYHAKPDSYYEALIRWFVQAIMAWPSSTAGFAICPAPSALFA